MGALTIVAHSKQVEAAAGGTDTVSYSAAYTAGGLVIGFQGEMIMTLHHIQLHIL